MNAHSPVPDDERCTGHVIRKVDKSGFCFVKADDGSSREYFAHLSNCLPGVWVQLQEGTEVSFVPSSTAKGLRALEVRLR